MRRRAALRTVEIDDMQPARAELTVAFGERHGISFIARLALKIAF
jgi:hypothetical protein